MILVIYILTPFTMTHSIHLFHCFRIIQTRMMVLAILHGLRPNPKLKSILEGCADLKHLWGSTLHSHNLFSTQFFQPQSVYVRFTHIVNMHPNSMWALRCTTPSTENTAAPENTSNSRTSDLSKPNWHFAIGMTTTTGTFGLRFQSTQTEQTIAASKWPSFKSGNPD